MATLTSLTRRVLIAGGFTLAVAATPLMAATAGHGGAPLPATAACPSGETLDPASGACKPETDKTTAPTTNPIDPEKVALQPDELTSSRDGNVGKLPEVNGIPCSGTRGGSGSSTGDCIGLSEDQNQFKEPWTSVKTNP